VINALSRFKVQGSRFKVQGSGFTVQGSRFTVLFHGSVSRFWFVAVPVIDIPACRRLALARVEVFEKFGARSKGASLE
jgi:hypothetical protein